MDSVKIDWNGIVNQNAIKPTITIPPSSWPTATQWADTTYYPIIRINGDFTPPSSGRGMLIVTGALTLNGSVGWKGVLLVGGDIVSNGTNSIAGATVSGLNVKLGTIMSQITVDVGGQTLVAAITRESAEHLELAAGDDVTVLIKATEVMLGK
jgi:molybdopterin-binding protein